MFLLIINVAHVLMTVNSSAGGVAAACWAPSWRTGCPLSFVEEGTRNKKAEGGTTQSVYFREGGGAGGSESPARRAPKWPGSLGGGLGSP